MARSLRLGLALVGLAMSCWAVPVRLECLQEPLSTEEQATLQCSLDWMMGYYERMGLAPEPSLRLRLFGDFDSFQTYQLAHRSFRDGSSPSRTAYYLIYRKELVTWRTPELRQLLVHESQHALLRSAYPNPPKWLNEGLSECFEGLDLGGAGPALRPQLPRWAKLRKCWNADLGREILGVVRLSEREFNRQADSRGLDSYTRSWALVYYLFSLPDGSQKVGELIRRLREGEDSSAVLGSLLGDEEPAAEAISQFYQELSRDHCITL